MDGLHLQWHGGPGGGSNASVFYGHQTDHSSYPEVDALGFHIPLDGRVIAAGGTYVFCREHRVSSPSCVMISNKTPLGTNEDRHRSNGGPCDVVIGEDDPCAEDEYCDSNPETENTVQHTGDDLIELRVNARPACVEGTPYEEKYKNLIKIAPNYSVESCGEAIDVVGIPGKDIDDLNISEKENYGVVDDNGNILFKDFTLRRKGSVRKGSPTWNKSQWDLFKHPKNNSNNTESGFDSISDLGQHSLDNND
jgi:hypothetical protein